jgi:hypothetical protein
MTTTSIPPPSWETISTLELAEKFPEAIEAIEKRLAADPSEAEAVIRLGFNLWYAVAEGGRLSPSGGYEQFAPRFVTLYRTYSNRFADNADFCWFFGLGMSLFWFYFPDTTEDDGKRLLEHARSLDPMWRHLWDPGVDLSRLRGRGILAAYYTVE